MQRHPSSGPPSHRTARPSKASQSNPQWQSQNASRAALKNSQKFDRACDACRRRKTRCDGSKMPDGICTNCVQSRKQCSYVEGSKPRGPPKAYVSGLEDRLEKMELLLKRLRPDADFSAELGPPVVRDSWKNDESGAYLRAPSAAPHMERKSSASSFTSRIPYPTLPSVTPIPRDRISSRASLSQEFASDAEQDNWPSDDYLSSDEEEPLATTMKRLTLLEMDPQIKANRMLDNSVRFHGSSSSFKLVTVTRELKMKHLLEMIGVEDDSIMQDVAPPVPNVSEGPDVPDVDNRREEYWTAPRWELVYEGAHMRSPSLFPELQECWPPPDLATSLMDLYFRHCNSMFPVLHRPTFEQQYKDRLYEQDVWFGCVCVMTFALASRYSSDERVLLDDPPEDPSEELEDTPGDMPWQRAGMKYYFATMGVVGAKRSVLTPIGLFEAQVLCLTSQFQSDTRWHLGAWVVLGIGVRKVEDVGAHRRKSYGTGPSVEDELWKRVWWYLVAWDRIRSVMLGRPCATREEDFDAELPLDVDDEYWENEDPKLAFKQPAGKTSMVAAYICWLRLTDIFAYVMRVFYSTEKSELSADSSDPKQPELTLKQVNEMLIEWTKTVPENLRWSSDIPDPILANQSATLSTTYHLVVTLLNRAFLPASILTRLRELGDSRAPVPQNVVHAQTCLDVAVNAAKSGSQILHTIQKRGLSNISMMLSASEVFVAVLCLDIWIQKAQDNNRKAKGLAMQSHKIGHMENVKLLLDGLEWAIPRWETAHEIL
ncbi:hypothetical protein FA95DRAFT_1492043 [Auriscalpium vulgare]|uniref:Uncharacterized protein n=1 Tax=Auriscalpium vulgare TaxID=40419 RepID=A0ACB8RUP3_9AGAM|nr:hypothetical protein FA95DRAFT_1492043 [Auriscalpium vulgare]